jgi:pilus assembly protein CpaF
MELKNLLARSNGGASEGTRWSGPVTGRPVDENLFEEVKAKVHYKLLDMIDLASLEQMLNGERVAELPRLIERLLQNDPPPLNLEERLRLVNEIQDEMLGLGPLESLLKDPTISDILVNNYRTVFIERRGKLVPVAVRFKDDAHLLKIINKIVSRVGRRIDESCPMVDARLPDGSRVNAIIPPIALGGPSLSIRRFAIDPLKTEDLLKLGTMTPEIARLLQAAVAARLNILISGGTGAGKTTLLNVLSGFIPDTERIVTIEDSAELQLQQQHVVRLETRPPNIEGQGRISQRDLVRNSLRMRPDRIIVGEVRGEEAIDMLQAMNTGHDGSLTTIHANSARDALSRLETMISMAGLTLSERAMRQQLSSAIHIVIQVSRLSDGSRKLVSLSELTGMEGDTLSMQEIFSFEQLGVNAQGLVSGRFRASGIRPKFLSRLKARGIELSPALFDPALVYEVTEHGTRTSAGG